MFIVNPTLHDTLNPHPNMIAVLKTASMFIRGNVILKPQLETLDRHNSPSKNIFFLANHAVVLGENELEY